MNTTKEKCGFVQNFCIIQRLPYKRANAEIVLFFESQFFLTIL